MSFLSMLKATVTTAVVAGSFITAASYASAAEYTKDKPLKVALVVHGNLGDKSFFDSAASGMKEAEAKLPVKVKIIETGVDRTKWEPAVADAADGGYDVVIVGTFEMTQFLTTIAPDHPDVKFIVFDDAPDYTKCKCGNVLGIAYGTSTAAYLAGYAGAKLSKTGVLSEVLGMEFKTVLDFAVGFEQGAKAANPNAKVIRAVANSFNDPAKGKELALAQFAQGSDVVFQIAGGTGAGALQAAKDSGKLAVGVDSDQATIFAATDKAQADVIFTSVEKKVGASLFTALEQTIAGKAPYGSAILLGLKDGAVGISKNAQYEKIVPEALRKEVDGLEKDIIAGKIAVDTTMK